MLKSISILTPYAPETPAAAAYRGALKLSNDRVLRAKLKRAMKAEERAIDKERSRRATDPTCRTRQLVDTRKGYRGGSPACKRSPDVQQGARMPATLDRALAHRAILATEDGTPEGIAAEKAFEALAVPKAVAPSLEERREWGKQAAALGWVAGWVR